MVEMMGTAFWIAIGGQITTLLAALGGYYFAGRNDEARDKRVAAREAESRREALAERLDDERHVFQRETLLALQEALQRHARVSIKINLQDVRTVKERGKLYRLPEGLADEEFEIFSTIQLLWARVLEPEVRNEVADYVEFSSMSSHVEGADSLGEEELLALLSKRQQQISEHYGSVNDVVGRFLRYELDRASLLVRPASRAMPAMSRSSAGRLG